MLCQEGSAQTSSCRDGLGALESASHGVIGTWKLPQDVGGHRGESQAHSIDPARPRPEGWVRPARRDETDS